MAGDWIKMRIDLQSHPKIVRILSETKSDKFRVIGGLHAVWSVFDTHSTDGKLYGYTPEAMDHVIGWPGFSDAMIAVNWLSWDGAETLAVPEFGEHNGQSAKRRAEDTKRKQKSRESESCPQNVRNSSDNDAEKDKTESGPEKRREEKSIKDIDSSLRSESGVSDEPPPVDPAEAKKQSIVDGIVGAYNRYAEQHPAGPGRPGCKRTFAVTKALRRKLLAANTEAMKVVKEQGIQIASMGDFWRLYFDACASDAWRRGEIPNPNNEAWKQSLDVLVDDTRFRQIMDQALAEATREVGDQ